MIDEEKTARAIDDDDLDKVSGGTGAYVPCDAVPPPKKNIWPKQMGGSAGHPDLTDAERAEMEVQLQVAADQIFSQPPPTTPSINIAPSPEHSMDVFEARMAELKKRSGI